MHNQTNLSFNVCTTRLISPSVCAQSDQSPLQRVHNQTNRPFNVYTIRQISPAFPQPLLTNEPPWWRCASSRITPASTSSAGTVPHGHSTHCLTTATSSSTPAPTDSKFPFMMTTLVVGMMMTTTTTTTMMMTTVVKMRGWLWQW